MKSVEEIALEVARDVSPEFVWEAGCEHECGVIKSELYAFATKFLAAVDAEQGKYAVALASSNGCTSDMGPGYQIKGSEVLRGVVASSDSPVQLFLHPTIPESGCGCKLVPDYDVIRDAERYRFLRDEENWVDDDPDFAIRPWETLGESSGKEFDSTIDSYMEHRKAMIQAAQE